MFPVSRYSLKSTLRVAPALLVFSSLALASSSLAQQAEPATPAKKEPAAAAKPPAPDSPEGMLLAADRILSGLDKGKSPGDAVKLLEKAADANHPASQVALARLLLSGDGKVIKQDPERAEFLIQGAAEAGFAAAQFLHGDILFSKIDPKARDVNYDEATSWYKKAAAQEDLDAMARVGGMQISGDLVPKNAEAGFKMLRQAARKGHPLALNECGICLQKGLGTERDEIAAIGYFQAAVDLGNMPAMVNLGACYRYGNGAATNIARAGTLFAAGAQRNFPAAQLMLGEMLEKGEGADPHPLHAAINYHRALKGGLKDVEPRVDALVAKFTAAEKKQWEEFLKTGEVPGAKSDKPAAAAGKSGK